VRIVDVNLTWFGVILIFFGSYEVHDYVNNC